MGWLGDGHFLRLSPPSPAWETLKLPPGAPLGMEGPPLLLEEKMARELSAEWRARGCVVTWETPRPLKLRVERDGEACPVTIYGTGTVVLQGSPTALRVELAHYCREREWRVSVQPVPVSYKGPRFDA